MKEKPKPMTPHHWTVELASCLRTLNGILKEVEKKIKYDNEKLGA